jgi:hypothetical protein
MIATNTKNRKKQKYSAVELEIQKLAQLEAKQFEALERRFTEDDLAFAWGCGYESRKREERGETGEFWTR